MMGRACWRCGGSLAALHEDGRNCPNCDALINPPQHWVRLSGEIAARLERKIAVTASIEVIESSSLEVERDGETWRDLGPDGEFKMLAELRDEIAYLTAIGRLRRHRTEKYLVKILEGR